jgi:HSP20 family protein
MTEPATTETPAKGASPSAGATPRRELRPMTSLGREIDRLFEEYLPWGPWRHAFDRGAFNLENYWNGSSTLGPAPVVDIEETDRSYELTAEAPGLDQAAVEVKFGNGVLKIRGEKKEEKTEQRKQLHISERRFGAFERAFRVPDGVDADKIEASLKDGVLRVTLPKKVEAQEPERSVPLKRE